MKGFSKFGVGGVRLVVDPTDDATPAMVYLKGASATFDCATGEGEVEGHELTQAQFDWLLTFQDQVDAAYEFARKDNPNYG